MFYIRLLRLVIELDLARKKLIGFVESTMAPIAPNLSAIVGSAVAAKLMVSAACSRLGCIRHNSASWG